MATPIETGNTYITYDSTAGGETDFTYPFPILDVGHIKVSVNDVVQVQGTAYTVNTGTSTVVLTSATSAGDEVKIWRNTEWLIRLVDFASGAQVSEDDLDRSALQLFYIIQELIEDNIAGTVTIDLGPGGGGGGGTGIGGINVIDYTMPSDTDTIPLGTEGLTKNVLQLYRNGVFVPPSDWEINPAGDTITTDYNFLTDDKVNVLYLFGSIVTTINTSVVTADAVTTSKIKNGEILYEDCNTTFDGNWASLADGDEGVAGMLLDLNTRVEALEAAATGDQVELKTITMTTSTGLINNTTFGFTPDYVIVVWNQVSPTSGTEGWPAGRPAITPGGTVVVTPGTQTVGLTDQAASETPADFCGSMTLSGATLTLNSNTANPTSAANETTAGVHTFRCIAVKEA